MFDKKAETRVPINDLIASRWSGRAYDPDRDVEEDQIIALLEAARWAPSCYGDQPWRYIVCVKKANPEAWARAFSCLAEGNQGWTRYAPVLMLAIADSIMSRTGKPNRWGQYDTGAASMSLCIQATELGLMVHQMGGFDADRARMVFAIPDQFVPMAMMTIGYQLPLAKLSGEIRERELAERARKPISEIFYNGSWGNPFCGFNL
jgi:nitroreductase